MANEITIDGSAISQGVVVPYDITYLDLIDLADEYARGGSGASSPATLKSCVRRAYDEVLLATQWNYLTAWSRVRLHAPQETGTVDYDADTRYVTLTGATWPTWTTDAILYLDGEGLRIESVISSTIAVVHEDDAPVADLSDETYSLAQYRTEFPLDIRSTKGPRGLNHDDDCKPMEDTKAGHPRLWWFLLENGHRYLAVYPAANAEDSLVVEYVRRPRPLKLTGKENSENVGTVTVAAGSVLGTSTTFSDRHVGSVMLLSSSTVKPSGLDGTNPYAYACRITSVADATHCTVDDDTITTTGVAYRITDPVDAVPELTNAIIRCVEKNIAFDRQFKDKQTPKYAYDEALLNAKRAQAHATPIEIPLPRAPRRTI